MLFLKKSTAKDILNQIRLFYMMVAENCRLDFRQQNIVIMKEREAPLNYQITLSNVTRIGSRSMADYYVTFTSQASNLMWKSPLIHGKVTKENTRFPWTFTADNHQLTVAFHELDGGLDKMVGNMPLLLMRREGEEEFLIFGCTQANRGRKVAEIDFNYVQCSVAASLPSNEESKRVSLQYTIEVQNYDNKKQLNMIPQQPEISVHKQSNTNIKLPQQSLIDERDFHPSRLDTLKAQTNRPRVSEDSNFELNLIREMEDATDRWYRNNFGKQKPSDLEHYDIEESRMAILRYQRSFQYLNQLSYTSPHMELKNLLFSTDKMPQAVQIYCIDLDGSQLLRQKVASMEVEGHRYNWPNAVRLPREKKAYGIQVVTADKERLQGLIIKDGNSKQIMEIYNRNGQRVGRANYTLKEIKKIQIQTMQLMELEPIQEDSNNINDKEPTNELDKSFLKSLPKTDLRHQSLFNDLLKSENEPSFRDKHKLIKQIYLNRSREQPVYKVQERLMVPVPEASRQMTNNAYLNKPVGQYPPSKNNFRRNKYEVDLNQPKMQASTPKNIANTPLYVMQEQRQQLPQKIFSSPAESSRNEINQFLPQPERSHIESDDIEAKEPSQQLSRKIEELKKIGSDLGKKAKAFPSKRFSKNAKYKTVVYNQDKQDEEWEGKRSLEHSDSGKQLQNHKKSYRQPINASSSPIPINPTPSFQSLLINNTFSNDLKDSKSPEPTKNITKIQPQKVQLPLSQPVYNISHLNSSQKSEPQINDDSEQVPITRHKTADQNTLKAMIKEKEADINKKKEENKPPLSENRQEQRRGNSFGVNTERMTIVPNVLQSSIVPTPTTPTQKRASPQLQDLKSIDYQISEWEGKRSAKEDVGSVHQSALGHSHQTKFSSQTIQPATQQPAGKLNFLITSISINYYQNCFGSKFVKIYVPNHHYYETSKSTNASNFFWKCSGFLFSRLHDHQDIYLQLINSDGDGQRMLGRVILNVSEFKFDAQQASIRAYLVLDSKIVGETVVGYQGVRKNRQNREHQVDVKRETVSLEQLRIGHSKKETTPIKRSKKKKRRDNSLNDSLTKFLRQNRKQKINRYIVNEYSRAHIDSRITPSVPRKYTTGKNIVIGRDIRFPFSVQEEQKVVVPGPGTYNQRSQFQRYQ